MIIAVEEARIRELYDYCGTDPFGTRILAAVKAYGLNKPFAQFWFMVDDDDESVITAAISKLDNGMTICAHGEYDYEEADTFVSMMNGAVIALRPARPHEAATGLVMKLQKRPEGFDVSATTQVNPEIEALYSVMESCVGPGFEIPDFESFYSDMLYRRKNGCVASTIVQDGEKPVACAAAHLADDAALLTLCAAAPEYRGKGFASFAVASVINRLTSDNIYVMCMLNLQEFYQNLGFVPICGFVC